MHDCYTVCVDDTAPAATPYYARVLIDGVYTELGLFTKAEAAHDYVNEKYLEAWFLTPVQFEDRYQEVERG